VERVFLPQGGRRKDKVEARGGIEPPMMVLQTIALPLGDRATERNEIWSGEGRRKKEAFAAQFPTLRCKLLPLASINGF
jgi:hypothetical protein